MNIVLTCINAALTLLIGILVLYFRSYTSSYAAKKGENLATHEDIQKLVDQVKAVTRTQEEIKASISEDLWSRQKRWELKKEAAFRMMECIGSLQGAVKRMMGSYVEFPPGEISSEEFRVFKAEARSDFQANLKEFNRMVGADWR
jgi:hypothetical protein